ncbi:hypothetical protein NQ318_008901 [Aromia moschata]|uniref:WD repeat-containing protein 55 homolog n=1 Tax=Aromia moschata TaxID=1265417 RepID=A0AAV8ZCZ6_9CUCU|nr:hypothetical protein NQ318_008901 [Aromia moschata]
MESTFGDTSRLVSTCVDKGNDSYSREINDSDSSSMDTNSESEENDNENLNNVESDLEENGNEEEEEDETIKAIIRECKQESDHPPSIQCEDFITDISFHPHSNIIAVANIVGDVLLYKYSNDENTLVNNLELHTKACRDIEFSNDGEVLFSVSKDKSIMLSDVNCGKLIRFYEETHEVPIYSLTVIDENLFSTGDDNGTVKIWDLRNKSEGPIYKTKKERRLHK